MPVWPSALPLTPLLERYRETAPDTLIRTQMDAGPAKVRRRSTAGVRLLNVSYVLDPAQMTALESFYSEDIAGGALAFSFLHPRLETIVSCRFRAPPSYTAIEGQTYRVSLELEILP